MSLVGASGADFDFRRLVLEVAGGALRRAPPLDDTGLSALMARLLPESPNLGCIMVSVELTKYILLVGVCFVVFGLLL